MSGEVQPRKRKDKRKKREDGSRTDEFSDRSGLNDKDDSDEKNHDDDSHDDHHGSTAGILAKIIFFILFTGLLVAISTVFFQLKGSEIADTPIKESRYASILENFVDEHPPDEHEADVHHGAEEHDEHEHEEGDEETEDHVEKQDEVEESVREKREEPEESAQQEQEDVQSPVTEETITEERAEEVNLEPSMPEEVSLPLSEVEDEVLDEIEEMEEEPLEEEEEEEKEPSEEQEEVAPVSETDDATENVDEEVSTAESEPVETERTTISPEELVREHETLSGEAPLEEQHPREEIPTLVDEETKKEYTKIIEDVLKEQQKEHNTRESYPAAGITNDHDFEFHKELDEAQWQIETAPDKAQKVFSTLLEKHPKSPRALYGKAMAFDRISELHRSNTLLEQSIYMYRDVLDLPDVPDDLYLLAGFRCVDRMRFRGFQNKALRVLQRMRERFPRRAEILNQIAVTYLLMSQSDNAKLILQEILKMHPNNGFAKAHYGFILKTTDKNYELAVKYLQEGIATEEPGTIDGRFYFHLGDGLTRLGKPEEALEVYEAGVKRGLFLSAYQRSLYNVNPLTARPWWKLDQTTYGDDLRRLEENWKIIRDEAVPLLSDVDQGFFPESEGLKKKGNWMQYEMFARGEKIDINCNRTPRTCDIISTISEASGCKRGQVKFSILMPGTHVWPHTGPTNCRLRAHLGLVVPEGARIRVANETRKWEEGKVIVFDDSFEHEVWHDGDSYRLILIVDFWHPELTSHQKQMLSAI